MGPVPLLDLKAQFETIRDDVLHAVHDVIESQSFILGPAVDRFEKEAAAYLGVPHAIGCASGSDALIISLGALGVGPGDEVLTTPFSFFATASCAIRVGARPRFVDIEEGTLNIDPARLEEAVTAQTRVLLPVHLFGQCADMDPILALAASRGLHVVEDACQALGSWYDSARLGRRRAGALGTTGCYSFFPSKNLGGFGDGGLVVTGDEGLADRLRMLRVHGARDRYYHEEVGWNSRLDSLQAAVLGVKLRRLDEWCAGRARNAAVYDRLLEEAGLLRGGQVRLLERGPRSEHIYHQYTLRVRDRDALVAHLRAQGIGHAIYYPVPLHLQRCFRDLGYGEGDFPIAEQASREVVSLPMYAEITRAQQERVVGALVSFYQAH